MVEKSFKTTHKKREEQVLCHGLQTGYTGRNFLALAAPTQDQQVSALLVGWSSPSTAALRPHSRPARRSHEV